MDAAGAIANSDMRNAANENNPGSFRDDEQVPTLGIADAAIATVNESWQEMRKAPNAAIRDDTDEGASVDDEEMRALALGAIANGNFLQGQEEEVDAEIQDGDVEASDDSDDDQDDVTELLYAELYRLLYEMCLILGSLVIAVSSAVAIYRVIYPNSFQYFLFVAWEGNSRSLWIPMLCASPLIVACFVCAAQLHDAVEIELQARALMAAVRERWDRRHIHRRRG
ncbi:uncharacterized protein LOC142765090 [Rhipicephalus microplus]|uniref:uncharacterized protein LOC142765090 n=1 Tax=Rhipicephalus microplus TaxID=6941 RepID=UPI003F6BB9C2